MLDLVRHIVAGAVLDEREAERFAWHGGTPVVVAPRDRDEAAAVLKQATEEGWSVLVVGAGTRVGRNSTGFKPDVVVTTTRLDKIAEYEPADLVLTAQAGASIAAISEATKLHKQFLALDPPVSSASTIGGIVATATAGPLRCAHGTPRDHVLGLELVAADGRVLHFGGKVVKNVAGYDVVRPIVGSRGSLGLITEVSVRLKPMPESDHTVMLAALTFDQAIDTAASVVAARLDTVALEIASPAFAPQLDSSTWVVAVRLHGNAEAVADSLQRLQGIAPNGMRASDASIWNHLGAIESEAAWVVRFANLPARLHETASRALHFAERAFDGGAKVAAHAGDGIVRLLGADAAPAFDHAVAEYRSQMAADGGTMLIERAAQPIAAAIGSVHGAQLMAGVKRVFDPAGILAPASFAL